MRVITKNEVKEPFRAPLGELVYELIGTSTETGGAKLHSLAHVLIPPEIVTGPLPQNFRGNLLHA
jgi:hypothetical protein